MLLGSFAESQSDRTSVFQKYVDFYDVPVVEELGIAMRRRGVLKVMKVRSILLVSCRVDVDFRLKRDLNSCDILSSQLGS
jgi:hypothetical protein